MKHYLIIIFFVLTSCPVLAQSEEWVRHVAGDERVRVHSISESPDGNKIYVTGIHWGEACLNNSDESYNCFSEISDSISGGFLMAIEKTGELDWVIHIPVYFPFYENYFDVEVDSEGYVYTSNAFNQPFQTTFTDGNSLTFQPVGGIDGYILKVDSLGEKVWVKQLTGGFKGIKMSLNTNGVVISGDNFQSDLDPGSGSFIAEPGMYIAQYNHNGDFIWGYNIEGDFKTRDVTTDNEGHIVVAGEFKDTINFNPYGSPSTLITGKLKDAFILKVDENGVFKWVKKVVQLKNNNPGVVSPFNPIIESTGVVADSNNNLYTAGYAPDTILIDPEDESLMITTGPSNNSTAFYLIKYNAEGDFQWLYKTPPKNNTDSLLIFPFSLSSFNDNIFVGGTVSGEAVFDSENNDIAGENGTDQGFLLKLDSDKIFNWVNIYEAKDNASSSWIHDILKSENNGMIYSSGRFFKEVHFPFRNKTSVELNSWGSGSLDSDGFIHKFQDPDYEEEIIPVPEFNLSIYPNPSNDYVEIDFGMTLKNVSIKVIDFQGKSVIVNKYSSENKSVVLNISFLASGMYIIDILIEENHYRKKFIKYK